MSVLFSILPRPHCPTIRKRRSCPNDEMIHLLFTYHPYSFRYPRRKEETDNYKPDEETRQKTSPNVLINILKSTWLVKYSPFLACFSPIIDIIVLATRTLVSTFQYMVVSESWEVYSEMSGLELAWKLYFHLAHIVVFCFNHFKVYSSVTLSTFTLLYILEEKMVLGTRIPWY